VSLVRRGVMGDLGEIVRIEQEASGVPRWGEGRYREILENEAGDGLQRVLLVAERCGGIVGFAVGTVVLDEAEIESVAVAIEARRTGVGKELCRALMEWARGKQAVRMRLEVRAGNAGARALYRGLGLAECGVRAGYYVDPVEDAVLMVADLAG
jgi:[ribosomal protein S18]-alanine N-acetyltransferase